MQLTHHSTSEDFPKLLPLLGLAIGAFSSPFPGQKQPAGTLGFHLGERSRQIIRSVHTIVIMCPHSQHAMQKDCKCIKVMIF